MPASAKDRQEAKILRQLGPALINKIAKAVIDDHDLTGSGGMAKINGSGFLSWIKKAVKKTVPMIKDIGVFAIKSVLVPIIIGKVKKRLGGRKVSVPSGGKRRRRARRSRITLSSKSKKKSKQIRDFEKAARALNLAKRNLVRSF